MAHERTNPELISKAKTLRQKAEQQRLVAFPQPVVIKRLGVGGIHRMSSSILEIDEGNVRSLAASMKDNGLINPLTVRPCEGRGNGFWLIAGAHRLAAAKRLKWTGIDCVILDDIDATAAELLTIDENLVRRELTPAQRAKLVAKRKAAYEALHPETKHGAIGRGRGKSSQAENSKRFTVDTASRTGRSTAAVARDVTRANALGPDLDRVAGTSLDTGAQLDALAKMPPEDRAPIIAAAELGEKVSAIGTTKAPADLPITVERWTDGTFLIHGGKRIARQRSEFVHRTVDGVRQTSMRSPDDQWKPLVPGVRVTTGGAGCDRHNIKVTFDPVTAIETAPDDTFPVHSGSVVTETVDDDAEYDDERRRLEEIYADLLDETSLGDRREWQALDRLPEADRKCLIAAAKRGEIVTARTDLCEMERAWLAFMEAAMRSSREDRETFYSHEGRLREVERLCDPTRSWRNPKIGRGKDDIIDLYAPFDQPVRRPGPTSLKLMQRS